MSDLDEFMSWCAKVSGSTRRDANGRRMTDTRFPYGMVSYWVREYKRRDNE